MKRDFIRCILLENVYSPCDVYSVAVCTDDIRNEDDLSEFEMNESTPVHEFVPNLPNNS